MEYTFTAENFENEVINSDKPVMIDFFANWCGPCRMMSPAIAKLAEKYDGKLKVGKVNVDEQQQLAAAFQVQSIPFIVFIKDKKVVDASIGAVPPAVLEEKIQKLI